ncbi:hypothetical protein FVE85_0888 [Porphyridium purpureum]|uniref:Uncharacterized protein n=1 Tax=Porphyridium purpureum TaxID=35688 RepID=A0A5J4YZV9_PORPP|nr:hypothetical protein FVE85_0888 [Porphyridium purpureum]|eukprot:POR5053..scf208_2
MPSFEIRLRVESALSVRFECDWFGKQVCHAEDQLKYRREMRRMSIDQLYAWLSYKNQSVAIGAGTRLGALAMEGLLPLNHVLDGSMLNAHYPSFAKLEARFKVPFRMSDQAVRIETLLDDAPLPCTPSCSEGRNMVKQHVGQAHQFATGNRVRVDFPEMESIRQRGLNVAIMRDAMFMCWRCPSVEIEGGNEDCVRPNKAEKSTAGLAEYTVSQKLADINIDLLECFRVGTGDPAQPPKYIYTMYGGSVSLMNDEYNVSENCVMISQPCRTRGIERMLALPLSAQWKRCSKAALRVLKVSNDKRLNNSARIARYADTIACTLT